MNERSHIQLRVEEALAAVASLTPDALTEEKLPVTAYIVAWAVHDMVEGEPDPLTEERIENLAQDRSKLLAQAQRFWKIVNALRPITDGYKQLLAEREREGARTPPHDYNVLWVSEGTLATIHEMVTNLENFNRRNDGGVS